MLKVAKQLESYITAANGVEWHRDQVTITITFADDTTERYDTNSLFEAWEKITPKIPNATKLPLVSGELLGAWRRT
jgi:hypothetical protein